MNSYIISPVISPGSASRTVHFTILTLDILVTSLRTRFRHAKQRGMLRVVNTDIDRTGRFAPFGKKPIDKIWWHLERAAVGTLRSSAPETRRCTATVTRTSCVNASGASSPRSTTTRARSTAACAPRPTWIPRRRNLGVEVGRGLVKTSCQGGPKGFDAGKKVKGRKRRLVVDVSVLRQPVDPLPCERAPMYASITHGEPSTSVGAQSRP